MPHPPTAPEYPAALEDWWLAAAARAAGGLAGAAMLEALRPDVARLSDAFTTGRATDLNDYGAAERAWLGYGLFFFPQTYVRTQLVLAELAAQGIPGVAGAGRRRVLDLGAGTGAAGLAAVALLSAGGALVDLVAIDRAPAALGLLRGLFRELRPALWPGAEMATRVLDAHTGAEEAGAFDLVLASFALNELFEGRDDAEAWDWVARALAHVRPGGALVLIEPATASCARRLQRLRDRVAAGRLARIAAPCLHARPCPMLPDPEAWCHEVRHWRAPESLRFLNRKLFRDVETLKFSFLALRPGAPDADAPAGGPDAARLVAPTHEGNGRMMTRGCAADGRLYGYELLTRGWTRAQREAFLALERGAVLRWEAPRLLGDGRTQRAAGACSAAPAK